MIPGLDFAQIPDKANEENVCANAIPRNQGEFPIGDNRAVAVEAHSS